MEKTYIVSGVKYSNIEDIPHEEFINSDGIITVTYMTIQQILEKYNVSYSTIQNIFSGRTWHHKK